MKVFILLAAGVAAVQPTISSAEAAPASETVSYADLDLRTAAGQSRLTQRIRSAAARLCTDDSRASPTGYVITKCYQAAVTDALGQAHLEAARARNDLAAVAVRRP